jgi:hypothetical protein
MRKRFVLVAAGGFALALVAAGGTALAANSGSPVSSTGVITGCYTTPSPSGSSLLNLQYGGTTCPKGNSTISWNQTGPQGATGATVATGATGAARNRWAQQTLSARR